MVGVPYTDEQIANAAADLRAQANPRRSRRRRPARSAIPRPSSRDFDGDPKRLTEMDALVAYLQMLGTLVDFKLYDAKANLR